MKKINLEMNVPENVSELIRLKNKIVTIIPGGINSVPMPLVYFDSHNGKYEFLQQEMCYNLTCSYFFISPDIHSDFIPQEALKFMKTGIYFDRIQYSCTFNIYWPKDEEYPSRLQSLRENKLWIPSREIITK